MTQAIKQRIQVDGATDDQRKAIQAIDDWLEMGEAWAFTLCGYAGTGKSWTIKRIVSELRKLRCEVGVSSTTNRAAHVLRDMLPEAKTIHSMLGLKFQPDYDTGEERLVRDNYADNDFGDYDLVIVDECSMIGWKLLEFIEEAASESGVRVLFVGDPAQLPPVGEAESGTFFVGESYTLTHVMRQALDSPILALATEIREDPGAQCWELPARSIEPGLVVHDTWTSMLTTAASLYRKSMDDPDKVKVVAWTNNAVGRANVFIREKVFGQGVDQYVEGDRIVFKSPYVLQKQVLFHNSEEAEVIGVAASGSRFKKRVDVRYSERGDEIEEKLPALELDGYELELRSTLRDGWSETVYVVAEESMQAYKGELKRLSAIARGAPKGMAGRWWRSYFEFRGAFADIDYAFALTVHKSQGGTYENVFVDTTNLARNDRIPERNQLLYVALTRASKELHMRALDDDAVEHGVLF